MLLQVNEHNFCAIYNVEMSADHYMIATIGTVATYGQIGDNTYISLSDHGFSYTSPYSGSLFWMACA